MRFLMRSLFGLVILGMTLGLLVLAAGKVYRAQEERNANARPPATQRERVFAVNTAVLEAISVAPVIATFGEVASTRTLELRAAASGRLVEIAPELRDGGRIEVGELLFATDPADAQTALELARAEIAEAEAEVRDAISALALTGDELEAKQRQFDLRAQALERQENLRTRGVGTEAAVESAALSLSSAEQSVLSQRQALAKANARVDRAEIALLRQGISLAGAERDLMDTRFKAPFSGVLSDVAAVRGRLVSTNEKLGVLIDPAALEVSFRISNTQFARLLDETGSLRPVAVQATLDLDGLTITVSGQVDRANAEVGEGLTGRLIFARLENVAAGVLRPGDFLSVEITEPVLDGVAVIPATAANSREFILLVDADERLEEAAVRILRRQADSLIVDTVPFGRRYVTQRTPQLGVGVKIRPVGDSAGIEAPEMVALSDEKRDTLMASVQANKRMPADVRNRLLEQLKKPQIRADTLARLESRMGARSEKNAETLTLADDRRARLVAFVEKSETIPADAKERILAQLSEPVVPKAMIDRLEARMGG